MSDIENRLDRLESSLEKLVNVVSGLAGFVQANAKASEERFRRIETIQIETTEKLNALVHIVDEWIRNKPSA